MDFEQEHTKVFGGPVLISLVCGVRHSKFDGRGLSGNKFAAIVSIANYSTIIAVLVI